ncbi:hypothetical protein Celly_0609 [Cellulophaga lytica DSM 7489]|uniref:Uncharacterized protein n=1 Tax=Cellulophaga lytica (strain ATCC 23178 / DSM 7489 / JCM 8516 / NBRC 14961 / NCIMB 1423 / VKM B-1433 / Cy l20) TaxID=867900 RepID=F0RAQ1_CELLC|nr:hypothetical protein [Cellulophaga lytica]ADY28444.1 hypothetical protein Celly_0609 [Cellulophaga lytica DSM 7489]WQG77379.1 hypothetical protein SR888_00285 [Cellulophaga lytica]
MKKLIFGLFLSTCLFTSIQAQVKIGENPENLHFNSVLELESTSKALVITRMSTLQMNAITPLNGAVIYNTDTRCLHYYNDTQWINLCEAENAGNINLVDNGDNTYTFTNAAGNDITFETPAFTSNHTGSGGVGFSSGIKITDDGNTVNIEVDQIHGNSILNKTIGRTKIADDAIGVDELGDTSVNTNNLIDESVTPVKIQPSATPNQVLKTNATGTNVEWGTLDATSIAGQDLTVDASLEFTGSTTGVGALLETVGISVADGGITNAKLAADAVSTNKIADETILSEDILDGTIATQDIADNAITAVKINTDVAGSGLTKNATTGALDVDVAALTGDGNITSTDLNVTGGANAALNNVTLEINPSAVGANELADGAVTTTKIADTNVTTVKIEDDAIENTKLADDAVQTENILDGTIATLDIADDAVTAIKINADVAGSGLTKNITTGALDVDVTALTGDGNITSTDLNVTGGTNAALNDVTLEINPSAVGANEIADGAVTTTKIADANVTRDKIANAAIDDNKLDKTTISLSGFAVPTGDLSIGSQKLTNVSDPTDPQDAATRSYVDAAVTAGTTALALKEDTANKSNDGSLTDNSATDFPTEQAVKTYVDNQISTINTITDGNILVGDATNTAAQVAISGDATLANTGALTIENNAITSAKILDDEIVNTDINSAAAIDGSKISPVFTSNVSTTGTLTTTGTATIGANTITNIDGTDGQVLTTDGAGAATWKNPTTGIPIGTAGSIFFSDGAGNLAENNTELFWDNTNNRLGIGRTNPQDMLDVEGQIRTRTGFAATGGTVGQPSYGFYTNGDTNTGMFRIAEDQIGFSTAGIQAITIDATQNVGIGITSPNSTLHTGGSLATAIDDASGIIALGETQHTIIITGNSTITLPAANTCQGRIYIIKNPDTLAIPASPDYSVTFTPGSSYLDSMGNNNPISLPAGITKLQSDGTNWQQIN